MNTKKTIKQVGIVMQIVLATAIGGVAFNLFILPNHFLSGGVSGVSLIISYLTGFNPGLLMLLLNIPIFLFGYRFVDREFIVLSLLGTFMLSFFIDAFSFLQGKLILDNLMLACIFGGILNGINYGLTFRVKASEGGTDIIAVVVKKYFSISIGTTGLIINILIVGLSVFIFKDITTAMYTLITMYVQSVVLDRIQVGFDIRKSVTIICAHEEEVGHAINEKLGRGVTYMIGEGAYTGKPRKVLYCIVGMNQVAKLKQIVMDIDPKAFIAVVNVNEVSGKGFSRHGI